MSPSKNDATLTRVICKIRLTPVINLEYYLNGSTKLILMLIRMFYRNISLLIPKTRKICKFLRAFFRFNLFWVFFGGNHAMNDKFVERVKTGAFGYFWSDNG